MTDRDCVLCAAWLDQCDIVNYGSYCTDCVHAHEMATCATEDCKLCVIKAPMCYNCKAPVTKVEDITDPNHPYPDQYYRCEGCDQYVVRCKGCYDTTVDWWEISEEVWDDILQCHFCSAVFCPTCNQTFVGCRDVGEDTGDMEIACDACPNPLTDRERRLAALKRMMNKK